MDKPADPRLDATRRRALDAALHLLETQGVLAVTHAGICRETGISRSTLYRHWPKLDALRNTAFARATRGGRKKSIKPADGTLRDDLLWILGTLVSSLNETPWGKIAPQVIGTAAVDEQAKDLLEKWVRDRSVNVRSIFDSAIARGEIAADAPVEQMIEFAISVPYFRKCMSGKALDAMWLETHVDLICAMAGVTPQNP
ncbi:TetR/AcrR family transcriptional regulator [Thalassococcus lentus]|uniref:TetR/AcrR family transcriptional regulator n=1 Tax=Thalassococcus lentus TaxID=1210524 RepID=A0ABT4XWP9_9RHOB|nr:TetR/AcrR family transcriptional regulator [Thalassococcus lentus]MDA7426396.1 TetR/AcrR family transcriptional regulator [Thalassococcus lentus]